ncbi:hypothetical protein M8J75_013021 [Diaphorina citri]|nr:hypothetical protein M8J75_013021 [Diaphorina citri]KAI5720289.1 hypothetical protein M8J77_004583 [Diaphorina citri]
MAQQQAQSSQSLKRSNLKLFSPETSSIKDFLSNIESNIIPHGHEKAFKQALYNGLALLIITVCSCTSYGVYLILQSFLKPLLWALICGTVLFPTKKIISNYLKHYVKSMQSHSMLLQTVYVPVLLVDSVSEMIGTKVQYMCQLQYMFHILGAGISIIFVYFYIPSILFITMYICSSLISVIYSMISLVQHFSVILLLCIAYASLIYFQKVNPSPVPPTEPLGSTAQDKQYTEQVKQYESTAQNEDQYVPYLKALSLFVWFSLSCYVASFFGPFIQSVLLILVQLLFLAGCLYEWYYDGAEDMDVEYEPETMDQSDVSLQSQNSAKPSGAVTNKKLQKRSQSDPFLLDKCPASSPLQGAPYWEQGAESPCIHTSDSYIYWVVCFCVLAAVLQNLYLLCIFLLFEMIYLVKHMCLTFGLYDSMHDQVTKLKTHFQEWFEPRQHIIFPQPLNNIRKMNILWRHWCLAMFQESSDAIASVLVILGLIFILIFATLFFLIQAYAETFHMVKIGGNIINQTLVHNPEVMQYLPEDWESKMDSVLNNTYTYGRVGISKMVANILRGVKKEKVAEFESTALELWDRIYQAWLMSALESDPMAPKVSSGAVSQSWSTFLDHIQKTPELMNMKTISVFLNNNMAMLSSGLESVWLLLKANMGLVIQALTTLVSLVFESGFAVFNFFINIVVFLTALFYLLSSSGRLYKPVQIITSVSPVYGNKLAVAIETAVHEVLTASFKLALFYGLWTWLIHSLFQVQLVYIPSAIASILAAIPILGPYWACVPGVLDLYLAQGNRIKALFLLLFQILPTFFVDTAIFNEIQGGHPYLTGLSVAGGVFWLGMEGAIIGPLLLCCLFVIVNMSTSIMRENSLPTPAH